MQVDEVAPAGVGRTALNRGDELLRDDHLDRVAEHVDGAAEDPWHGDRLRCGLDRIAHVDVDVEAHPCARERGWQRDPRSRVARALLANRLGARHVRRDGETVVDLDGRDLDDRLGDGLDRVIELETGEVHVTGGATLVEGGEEDTSLEDESLAVR